MLVNGKDLFANIITHLDRHPHVRFGNVLSALCPVTTIFGNLEIGHDKLFGLSIQFGNFPTRLTSFGKVNDRHGHTQHDTNVVRNVVTVLFGLVGLIRLGKDDHILDEFSRLAIHFSQMATRFVVPSQGNADATDDQKGNEQRHHTMTLVGKAHIDVVRVLQDLKGASEGGVEDAIGQDLAPNGSGALQNDGNMILRIVMNRVHAVLFGVRVGHEDDGGGRW
mmetsp:Transcript_21662/g.33127  ORF Transcript_21662/g.33127 Transcript_21662/m.33127 type:complete len:222 (-) Transcript_21662:100-765(-)